MALIFCPLCKCVAALLKSVILLKYILGLPSASIQALVIHLGPVQRSREKKKKHTMRAETGVGGLLLTQRFKVWSITDKNTSQMSDFYIFTAIMHPSQNHTWEIVEAKSPIKATSKTSFLYTRSKSLTRKRHLSTWITLFLLFLHGDYKLPSGYWRPQNSKFVSCGAADLWQAFASLCPCWNTEFDAILLSLGKEMSERKLHRLSRLIAPDVKWSSSEGSLCSRNSACSHCCAP